MGKNVSTDEFLNHHSSSNFQVQKIAGCEDLERAKSLIRERFILVGAVEQFDEFLVLLSGLLGIDSESLVYRSKNQATGGNKEVVPAAFADRLREQNKLDTALFEWVKSELLDSYISGYPGDFQQDLDSFRKLNSLRSPAKFPIWCDTVYRNLYVKPISSLVRKRNGLPSFGSYRY